MSESLEKMEERIKEEMEGNTKKIINFISATTLRELKSKAVALLENIMLKRAYIDSLDDISVTLEMAIIIAGDIEYFEDTSDSLALQNQLDYTCKVELQKTMSEGEW